MSMIPGIVFALLCAPFASFAFAQDTYPSKPIALVVPFPPGGVADIVGRPFADALSRELKTPVVIENKPGAGTTIGTAALYQLDQFTPIARLTADPTVLAVRADSPWKTLQDFVDDARKRPGAIT